MYCDDQFPYRLQSTRAAQGKSQSEIAEAAGIAATQLSRYESGRASPRPETAARIAKALGVTEKWLTQGGLPVLDGGSDADQLASQEVGASFVRITLPQDLAEQVEQAARSQGRSIAAEIVHRLQATFVNPSVRPNLGMTNDGSYVPPEGHRGGLLGMVRDDPMVYGERGLEAVEPQQSAQNQKAEEALADRIAKQVTDRITESLEEEMRRSYLDYAMSVLKGVPSGGDTIRPKPGRPDIPHAKAHKTPKK